MVILLFPIYHVHTRDRAESLAKLMFVSVLIGVECWWLRADRCFMMRVLRPDNTKISLLKLPLTTYAALPRHTSKGSQNPAVRELYRAVASN